MMVTAAEDARFAEVLAVNVNTLVPVVGLGLNDAVTPLGSPDTVRLTLPVKPFWPVTVTFDVPEAPLAMVIEVREVASVNPVLLNIMLCEA